MEMRMVVIGFNLGLVLRAIKGWDDLSRVCGRFSLKERKRKLGEKKI